MASTLNATMGNEEVTTLVVETMTEWSYADMLRACYDAMERRMERGEYLPAPVVADLNTVLAAMATGIRDLDS